MNKSCLIHRKTERGQSFAELAVSMVFLLVLFSAAVDLGWAFYTMVSLRDTAQEAASFGAICTDEAKVKERLKLSAASPIDMKQIADVSVCFSDPLSPSTCKASGVKRGDDVTVTVRYLHQIVTPFVGAFINSQSYPLVVTVSDTVMQDKQTIACDPKP